MPIDITNPLQHINPGANVLHGSFKTGVLNVSSSYTLPVTSGTDILVTADVDGVAGDDLDLQATDDGTAAATCSIAFGTDTLAIAHATPGVGANGLVVYLIPGGTAASEVATEDAAGNLHVSYAASTSTTTQVAAAIDGHANWVCPTTGTQVGTGLLEGVMAGGTAATWAEESGTPSKTHLHFTDAVSTVTASVAALNTLSSGTKTMTASGSGAHTLASADVVAKQDLAGGVDVVAGGAEKADEWGQWSAVQTAIGTYVVTFGQEFTGAELLFAKATLALGTAAGQFCILGAYSATARTLVIYVWDKTAAALADPTAHADTRISFVAHLAGSGV